MKVKLSSLKADLKKESDGDWVSYPELGDPDVAFKVRSINFPPYQAAVDREAQRLAQKYGNEPIPREDQDRITGRLLAEHILLDWRGMDEAYSADLAAECMADPAFRELRLAVLVCAQRLGRPKIDFVEDAAKN